MAGLSRRRLLGSGLFFLIEIGTARADRVVPVRNLEALRAAVKGATPGTRIEIAPGEYDGGIYAEGVYGEPGRPIIITAADPQHPPMFQGEGSTWHFSGAGHIVLSDIHVTGSRQHGISIDDGGKRERPARNIVLRRITVSDIGPTGNVEGFKLAGVNDFEIDQCRISHWGIRDGQGIDCVGCHKGRITDCLFLHDAGERTGAVGLQLKGGSRDVLV